MTTLKLTESKCSEPILVSHELIKKCKDERHILINGIMTHFIKTMKDNSYDGDKMKEALWSIIDECLLGDGAMRCSRVEVNAQHVMTFEKLGDNYVFNYIKVTPEYE